MSDQPWTWHVEHADAHHKLGTKEIYLSKDSPDGKPWQFVTKCEPGGGHRLEMGTSVWFYAKHPQTGLEFRWSFDIEPHSANGKGHYEIDVDGVRQVLSLIPKKRRGAFQDYLRTAANAVRANAKKYSDIAQTEYGVATTLADLADIEEV